ncbi:ester cyclase [Sphaerimonospora cavernae]|uniref:Ester cyclase n=1 Tax=Sphaerimonospora cavernae TaxID=1740611 RepID=A0ABV6U1K1_9ACTN
MPANIDAIVAEIHSHLAAENAQDLDELLDGMTEDCFNLVVPDPHRLYAGPEEVARRYRGLWATFPDLKVQMRRIISVQENIAVSEHTLSGTHGGSLFGVPATGRHVEVETAVVWDIVDGRIRGETVYFDLATMLRQVGHLQL